MNQYYNPYQAPVYGDNNEMPSVVQINPNAQPTPTQQRPPMPVMPPQQVSTSGGVGLSFDNLMNGDTNLPVVAAANVVTDTKKKKRTPKKKEDAPVNHAEEVNQVVYSDTYDDTNAKLHDVINQFDMVASEMKEELDKVISSRAMKGRHMAINNIARPLTDALNGKLAAIKEMNSSIKSINDMEYRRAKDNRNFESAQGDDKAIMDLYNAFIQAPVSANIPSTGAYSLLGPNMSDAMFGANSTNANGEFVASNGQIISFPQQSAEDMSYNNYINNLTPEQNAMLHEGTTETVIVYDKATGAKSFEVVDSTTMQPVPNMPIPDPMFLSDVTVDVRNKIARNTNLGQVYKVITLNDDIVSEY